jgi:hypothetical protein
MKIKKIISALFLTVISAALMTSCDFDIKDIVWPYSDNGGNEIKLNFSAIQNDTYKGVYYWDITYDNNGTSLNFGLKYYADKSGTVKKEKFLYKSGTDDFAMLSVTDTSAEDNRKTVYYTDETAKTFSTGDFHGADAINFACDTAWKYGIIKLTDNNIDNWIFVKKTENVSVTNYEGDSESAVRYEYDGAGTDEYPQSVKMFADFQKTLTPLISRIYYEIYDSGTLSGTVTVYAPLQTDEVSDTDFEIPSAENGYTAE